jgi:hypothetical protein
MPFAFSDARVPRAPVTDSGAERFFLLVHRPVGYPGLPMATPRDVLFQLLVEMAPSFRILECTESRFKQYSLCVERPGKPPALVLLPQSLVVKAVSDAQSRQAVRSILHHELLSPLSDASPPTPEKAHSRPLARCPACLGLICVGVDIVIRHGEMVHRSCPPDARLIFR